jgi:hypothetical protein
MKYSANFDVVLLERSELQLLLRAIVGDDNRVDATAIMPTPPDPGWGPVLFQGLYNHVAIYVPVDERGPKRRATVERIKKIVGG